MHKGKRNTSYRQDKREDADCIVPLCLFTRGAGGSRTLVQTGKPYAFYMLIPTYFFVSGLGWSYPARTLSSEDLTFGARPPRAISDLSAPPYRRASEQELPGDVSSQHLVKGLSFNLLYFD